MRFKAIGLTATLGLTQLLTSANLWADTSEASSPPALNTPAITPPPPARPTMQKFAEQLSFLLQNMPAMGQPSAEQKSKVLQSLQLLKNSSHQVQSTMQLYAVDPVMRYLSLDLPRHFAGIESAYSQGQYAQARYLLRKTTQTCVACHSASSNKNSAVMSFPEPMAGIGQLERAEYFAATRRHEEAMLAYEKMLKDRDFKTAQPERWTEALSNLIAITIRLRNSPHVTLEMLSSLLEEPALRPEQKAMLQAWRAEAKTWTQEKLNPKLSSTDILLKAQSLYQEGLQASKKIPQGGYIAYLRAMTLLNELAMSSAPEELKANGFYLSGEIAQKLKDIQIWSHPEAYYEACIRSRPHSAQSQKCWGSVKSLALTPEQSKQLGALAQ